MAESQTEERMCIPEHINFDKLNRILIAYLKAGADKKAVNYRDASLRSGIIYTVVSANNKFFSYAGFLTEEKRGLLKLTERGARYAQLMDWGRLEEAKLHLGTILTQCSIVKIALDYVAISNEVTRDDLNRKIGSAAKVSRDMRFTVGINALIDMLVFSELLEEKGDRLRRGKDIITIESPSSTIIREEERPVTTPPSPFGTFGGLKTIEPKEVSVPISLTINVTDVTDVQKLREILKAIREELSGEKQTE